MQKVEKELSLEEEMALIPENKKVEEKPEDKEARLKEESAALFGTPGRLSGKTTPVPPRPEVQEDIASKVHQAV